MCYAPETLLREKKGDQWMDSYSNNLNWIATPKLESAKISQKKHETKVKYHKCETSIQIKMMHEERNEYAEETYYI